MSASSEPNQFDRLGTIDWDILLVLDAARWDIWHEQYGYGDPVWSPASCTLEWVPHAIEHIDDGNTLCVTANPTHAKHYPGAFPDRVDMWITHWKRFNGIPTVSPKDTSDVALQEWDASDCDRLYVHYIQPHGPYPWSDPPIPLTRANPLADQRQVTMPDNIPNKLVTQPQLAFDKLEWLTPELLMNAYHRNLAWVFDALLPFKQLSDEFTVVVTSDHGEYLCDGEGQQVYGHPCGIDGDPILQSVPLWVI